MNDNKLDEQILDAIRNGNGTRGRLMAIEHLRLLTWPVVAQRLDVLAKRGALIAGKAGWRIA